MHRLGRQALPYRAVVPPTRRHGGSLSPSFLCPSCGAKLPTVLPTCPKCRYIAPLPSSMSYFQYFDLPATGSTNLFKIDTRDLRRRFLQAQRLCHPDTWGQKGQKESTLAAAQSSQLNKAYQTLLSPLDRAHYILSLQGVVVNEREGLQDEEFIIKVMEARQEIEEAANAEEIGRIKDINKDRIDRSINELEMLIGEKNWDAAKNTAVRLKYWLGIETAAKEWPHG